MTCFPVSNDIQEELEVGADLRAAILLAGHRRAEAGSHSLCFEGEQKSRFI